jgi:hypothetical protein
MPPNFCRFGFTTEVEDEILQYHAFARRIGTQAKIGLRYQADRTRKFAA